MARITDYIKDRRILSLIIVVLLLLALDIFYGTGHLIIFILVLNSPTEPKYQ